VNAIQQTLRKLLKERGMTFADLALATGLSESSVEDQLHGRVHFHRRAWKIESVLNTPIWTPAERFAELRRCSSLIGVDVMLTGFQELRRRAIALKVPGARLLTNRDDLVSAVLAHGGPTQ
jgi:transcriptional regulator with XRE-family HTH domain